VAWRAKQQARWALTLLGRDGERTIVTVGEQRECSLGPHSNGPPPREDTVLHLSAGRVSAALSPIEQSWTWGRGSDPPAGTYPVRREKKLLGGSMEPPSLLGFGVGRRLPGAPTAGLAVILG